jgi:AAA15 family ATPase/GTPase
MRINEISIQNYKCFHDTKIEGFERVNLIGGRNNSGKTVLLEALHLVHDKPTGKLAIHSVEKKKKRIILILFFIKMIIN